MTEKKRRWRRPDTTEDEINPRGQGYKTAKKVKTKSSKAWIERQLNDPYVQRAMKEGYRSRAAYKLLEIHERYPILRKSQSILDLGCAPGGWLQVAAGFAPQKLIGIDLLPVEPLEKAILIKGDIEDDNAMNEVLTHLGSKADLILSDMAAATTGHRQTDHIRTNALVELAYITATKHLKPGGHFCAKVFQGGATKQLLKDVKQLFEDVRHYKPPASRQSSPETFLIARNFLGASQANGIDHGL